MANVVLTIHFFLFPLHLSLLITSLLWPSSDISSTVKLAYMCRTRRLLTAEQCTRARHKFPWDGVAPHF
jgi:hypothetical protein